MTNLFWKFLGDLEMIFHETFLVLSHLSTKSLNHYNQVK